MSRAASLCEQGNAFYLQGRFAEAAECYRQVLLERPGDVDALSNLGAALADLGQWTDAVACYQQAIRINPSHAGAHYNLGNALRTAKRYAESVESYARALVIRPDFAEAHNNIGIALRRLGRLAEASASFLQALALRPTYTSALVNYGLTLAESGRLAEALACYDEALRREPENPDAHHNRALAWLLLGEWSRGWPEYHWRWRCEEFRPPTLPQPLWSGEPIEGRTILLYTEQGLGDVIQFVRYARLVKERGATVLLAAPARLLPLLAGATGIDRLLKPDDPLPQLDVHCPLMSLPAVFGTTPETVPGPVPYLSAQPERVEHWRTVLAPVDGLRVGIAWRGSPAMLPYDHWRSIPLERFEPLARVEGVRLISLQVGPGTQELAALAGRFPVVDLGTQLEEPDGAFLETAAIMANVELVITCDTALAHLGGALGVATWVALPAVPEWRWLLEREDSPWYPSVRLFRQSRAGNWEEPVGRMAEALRKLAASRRGETMVPIEITPGELIDRLVILQIKACKITDPGKLRNVHAELESIRPAADRLLARDPELPALAAELRKANEALWDIEDRVREFERQGDFGPAFVAHARAVYHNNDARALLKRRINERLGCARQEEKQYAKYKDEG